MGSLAASLGNMGGLGGCARAAHQHFNIPRGASKMDKKFEKGELYFCNCDYKSCNKIYRFIESHNSSYQALTFQMAGTQQLEYFSEESADYRLSLIKDLCLVERTLWQIEDL